MSLGRPFAAVRDGVADRAASEIDDGMKLALLFITLTLPLAGGGGQSPTPRARVVPVYWVPLDETVPPGHVALTIDALDDVRRWYAGQLGGRSFRVDPLVVQRSRHTFAELSDQDFQAWWPLGQREFADYGIDWTNDDVKLLLVTRAAGAWAGSDSENGGIHGVAEAGAAQAGVARAGDLGGFAVIGDSSLAGYLAGVCPEAGREGGTAWWCSWATFRGTVAHELGHTWGVPHPDAFVEGYRCGEGRAPTVLQCHWAYPEAGLLDYERRHLLSLRYFEADSSETYRMLTDEPPAEGVGFGRASFTRDSTITWLAGHGGGTGYPWAIVLSPRPGVSGGGAMVRYELPGVVAFAAEVGVTGDVDGAGPVSNDGSSYRVEVVDAGGRLAAEAMIEAGAAPARLAGELDGRGLILRVLPVEGEGGSVVFGNPRVWVR